MHISGIFGTGKSTLIWKGLELAAERQICAQRIEVRAARATVSSLGQLQTMIKDLLSRLAEAQPEGELKQWSALESDWRAGLSARQFKFCAASELDPEAFGHDLRLISKTATSLGYNGLAIFIDEAQLFRKDALLAVKSALAASSGILATVSTGIYRDAPTIEAAAKAHFTQIADDSLNRLFSTIIPLGVFQGNEAKLCITTRLELDGADLTFDDDVIDDIPHITGGLPFEVIELSRELYELAEERGVQAAGPDLLLTACRTTYPIEWTEVAALLDSTSPAEAEALCALGRAPHLGSVAELVRRTRSGATTNEVESDTVQWTGMLKRFAERHPEWCEVVGDDVYLIKPIVAYLLRERLSQAGEMG